MVDQAGGSQDKVGAAVPNRINRLLKGQAQNNYASLTNLVMVKNLGLNSEQTVEMRTELTEKGIAFKVVRNRVTLRAFLEMGVDEAAKLFDGSTAIIEAEDPVTAAKVAAEFCKKFEKKLEIIGGLVEGNVLDSKGIIALSKSKTKPELLAEISTLVTSPGATLSAQLKGPGSNLAGVVKALVEKLEEGDEGSEAKEEAA